ncbi:hypothetical protein KCU99_g7179, partial [Aureobasidium melanogenum]
MDETECEIYDPFDSLSPSERSETMSKALSQFGERMRDNNQRILKRVLDIIASTDGDEELHLNILATHLDKWSSETVYTRTRTDDIENTLFWDPTITRLRDFEPWDWSISELKNAEDPEKLRAYAAEFLKGLELAVRAKACRELLGDTTVDNLRLPAEYYEFARQCGGLASANYDREVFLCDFSSKMYCPEELAGPLDKIEQFSGAISGFYFAAGWKAGENYDNCVIYYALTQHVEEPEGPWRWRVFVNNWEVHEWQGPFDDIFSFMEWYCDRYNQVPWDCVQSSIRRTHEKCKAAFAEAT